MTKMRLWRAIYALAVGMLATLMFCASPAAASGPLLSQQTKLEDAAAQDREAFGDAVSTDGTSILVGSPSPSVGPGSAHVYVRQGSGWALQQDLIPDLNTIRNFGIAVAIDGNTAAIGASIDSTAAMDAGAVYIFVRTGTTWSLQQKLVAPDAAPSDLFGDAVALSGNTVAVGVPDSLSFAGSVYTFTRTGTTWSLQQKLVPADVVGGDFFGWSLALDQNTFVAGAPRHTTGAAYVYARTGSTWSLQQELVATGAASQAEFGFSVALNGDTIVVGDVLDSIEAAFGGAAYVFTRAGTTWTQQEKLFASDEVSSDSFGSSVAVNGSRAVVSSPFSPGGAGVGAAYVFDRNGTNWSQTQKVTASDGVSGDQFGSSVAASSTFAVIGAPYRSDQGIAPGAIYVFGSPPVSAPAMGRYECLVPALLLAAGFLALRRRAARATVAGL